MNFSKSAWAPRGVAALLALIGLACASGGSSGDGASSPDGVDCDSFTACDDKQQCSGGAACFKIKKCPGFVCADVESACKLECGSRACLVLESHPMMMSCR
jgi:hypothetical protein